MALSPDRRPVFFRGMNDISPTSPGEISTVVGSVNALFVGLDEGAAHGGHASASPEIHLDKD